jgi:hypothetical protein
MENQQPAGDRDRRKIHVFYLIIIAILATLCGILGWQYTEQKNRAQKEIVIKEQVIVERESIKNDLLELRQQYTDLQTSDLGLQKELEEKRAQIDSLIVEAEKHKGDSYYIAKLKKETETLRQIMKGYVRTIDSLNTLNQKLIVEKNQVTKDLNAEKDKSTQLTKEKENLQGVVNLASALKASSMKATGVRFRSGGKKEDETNKARRVEKLKVVFTLGVNELAKTGERTMYLRIMTPDGKELAKSDDESSMMKFNGSKGFFASKSNVDYNKQETMVKMLTEKKDDWLPGKYNIQVICDELVIGETSVTLE